MVKFMSRWQNENSSQAAWAKSHIIPTPLSCALPPLDSFGRVWQYHKTKSDQSLWAIHWTALSVPFTVFCSLIHWHELGQFCHVWWQTSMQHKEAAQDLIWSFYLQERLYGGRASVTHPSALESLSKFTDAWQEWAMASENGKLWTFSRISSPNETLSTSVWVITVLLALANQRCLSSHSSRLNEWQIKVSQTRTLQEGAADWFLI